MAEVAEKKYLDYTGLTHYTAKIKGEISKVGGDLSTLKTAVEKNTTDIAKNAADIAQNASDIAANAQAITDHIALYDALSTVVTTNTTNIAKNATEIDNIKGDIEDINDAQADQDAKISALETAKSSLEDRMTAAEDDITQNTTDIAQNASDIADLKAKTIKSLTLGGVVYNGDEAKTVTFGFVEKTEGASAGDIDLTVGGTVVATLPTSKFTKDAMLDAVEVIDVDGVKNIKFTFNLANAAGGHDVILVPLSDIFSGKATDVKLVNAINNDFVNVAAGTDLDATVAALAAAGNDLKTNLEAKDTEIEGKIDTLDGKIADNAAAIAAFKPITNAEIDALFPAE